MTAPHLIETAIASHRNQQKTDQAGRGRKGCELLLRWAGDDPSRELIDTPARVVRAYEEFFSGYQEDPEDMLARTFEEVEGYDDMVMLRGIDLQSHCEHHMVPILGQAHIAYLPDRVLWAYPSWPVFWTVLEDACRHRKQ